MQAVPLPDADEARDNAAFAALLAALSRPGSVQVLPEAGPATLARALLDTECRVWAGDDALRQVIRSTGAVLAPPEEAGHVFLALDDDQAPARLSRLHPGTALYPDAGATVIAPAAFGAGPALRLSGPGVEGQCRVQLAGVHPGVWAARAALCRYPLGVEMVLVDGARILALPRSTLIEVA